MNQPSYNFVTKGENYYEFLSVSEQKTIRKAIAYTAIIGQDNWYNLSLVDILPDGTMDDKIVSDNGDMEQVFATIINTLHDFFKKNISSKVFFRGSTESRTRLYRVIISKLKDNSGNKFEVWGVLNNSAELFKANQPYEAFVIRLKAD